MATVVGIDIGGANLKCANRDGCCRSVPFELWKSPGDLAPTLARALAEFPFFDTLAVTMTGELCDCFDNRIEGVHHILSCVEEACPDKAIAVWTLQRSFVSPDVAKERAMDVASANWLAGAILAARYADQRPALYIDIGSTTTDIVPIGRAGPIPSGKTDAERLQNRELVYTGVGRTPICALLCSEVFAELFATTGDAYLLLEDLPEKHDSRHTADGRPADREHAHKRLARMIGKDGFDCTRNETKSLARRAAAVQTAMIVDAVGYVARKMDDAPERVIVAGAGEFLGRRVARELGFSTDRIVSIADKLGTAVSEAVCAYAVATLATDQCPSLASSL